MQEPPSPGDFKKPPPRWMISRADATKKAAALLQKCGITPTPPAQVRYLDYPHSAYCEVYWADFMVSLSQPGAGLVMIENHRRLKEREKGIRRSGPYKITSEGQAKERVMQFARGSGVPSDTILTSLRINPENSGEVVAEFTERTPGGYRFHGDSAHVDSEIHVDMRDGQLLSLVHYRSVYYRATKPVVTPDTARQKAVAAYQKQGLRGQPDAATPGLRYVLADEPGSSHGPPQYTLAYIVRFGKDQVWVDAENGSVIAMFHNGQRVRNRGVGAGAGGGVGF
jgi:hypothetical protein